MYPVSYTHLDVYKRQDEGYTKAITKMIDMVDLGLFEAGATSTDYETAQSLFTTGQAAMFINGDWDISSLTEKLGDDLGYFESYPMADAGKENEQNPYALSLIHICRLNLFLSMPGRCERGAGGHPSDED